MPRATAVAPVKGRFIVGKGERTGHNHSVPANPYVAFLTDGMQAFLSVKKRSVKLSHQEHASLTIVPGNYEVVQQRHAMPGQEQRVVRVID
jgi:hypothetical protein